MFISDDGLIIENAFTGERKEFEDFSEMRYFLALSRTGIQDRYWYPVLEDTSLLDIDHDLQEVVDFYTNYFPVMIKCDGISTLVIPGRSIPIVKGGKMLLDLEDIPRFEYQYAWLRAENDPAVLKGYLPQLNKIRENVDMEDEEFELFGIWTGWFENFVKKENPAFAEKTAFLRSFDRWAVSDPDSFEATFHIDWGTFICASAEHYELTHKTLPAYPGTGSPAVRP